MKKYMLALAATFALFASPLYARQTEPSRKIDKRPSMEQIAEQRTERAARLMELTDAQRKQIYEINLKELKQSAPHVEQLRRIHADLAVDMKKVLTDEQYAAWSEARRPRHGKELHKGHRSGCDSCRPAHRRDCKGKDKHCNRAPRR